MVDVNKILNSEKYMQIADALLNDGKIDAEELKRLGLGNLTPKEQEELNTALSFRFSSASNSEIDGPEHTDGRQESRVERYLSEQKKGRRTVTPAPSGISITQIKSAGKREFQIRQAPCPAPRRSPDRPRPPRRSRSGSHRRRRQKSHSRP